MLYNVNVCVTYRPVLNGKAAEYKRELVECENIVDAIGAILEEYGDFHEYESVEVLAVNPARNRNILRPVKVYGIEGREKIHYDQNGIVR